MVRLLRSAVTAWAVAGVLALAVVGLAVGLTQSSPALRAVPGPGFSRVGPPFGVPGRFGGLFPGGVVGTVAAVGSGSFTVTTLSGQTATVQEQTSTLYYRGGAAVGASAVTKGERVAVSGTRSGNTVRASRVVILPAEGAGFRQ